MSRIPLHVVPEADDPHSIQVFADGAVGGETIRFLVDTGATTCLVPLTAATAGLATTGPTTGAGASGAVAEGDVVIVPELRIGELVVADVEADRADLGPPRFPLVGMNVLGAHSCMFRFGAGVVEIDAPPPDGAERHVLDHDDQILPFIDVQFCGTSVSALWDSGASRSVVDQTWAQRHSDLVEIRDLLPGSDSSGVAIEARDATLAACSIGGIEVEQTPCVVIDLAPLHARMDTPIDVVVGVPIMLAADWWFDFPNRRWSVTHPRPSTG